MQIILTNLYQYDVCTWNPSRVHVNCGGGLPVATHFNDTVGPGCNVCSEKIYCNSGDASTQIVAMRKYINSNYKFSRTYVRTISQVYTSQGNNRFLYTYSFVIYKCFIVKMQWPFTVVPHIYFKDAFKRIIIIIIMQKGIMLHDAYGAVRV